MSAPKNQLKMASNGVENINSAPIKDETPIEQVTISKKITQSEPVYETPRKSPEQIKRDHEMELTKGKFRNFENPGKVHKFAMRLLRGVPLQKYELMDDKVYELPRCVARYINQNCWYPEHEQAMDEMGVPLDRLKIKTHRFAFDNGEYYEDPTPIIITPNKPVFGMFN